MVSIIFFGDSSLWRVQQVLIWVEFCSYIMGYLLISWLYIYFGVWK